MATRSGGRQIELGINDNLDATFERLTLLAEQTPAFSLEIGRDPARIARAVAQLTAGWPHGCS